MMKYWRRVLLLIVSIALLYLLRDVLSPFLFSFLFAYLCQPLVKRFEQHGLKRVPAILSAFSLIFLFLSFFIFIILPLMGVQFLRLFEQLPQYLTWFKEHILIKVAHFMRLNIEWNVHGVLDILQQNASGLRDLSMKLWSNLLGSANYFFTFLSYLFLLPLISFYLLRDWQLIFSQLQNLIPPRYLETTLTLSRRCDDVLSGFFQGQFLVMLALGILYALGLSLLGLEMALGIGLLAGLVSFIPYLGLIVGMTLAIILAILQFQNIWHPLGVIAVFAFCQSIEAMYLTPKWVGDRTGLHPLAVLFAVLAGGKLWGFSGILWALPVAAMANVFLIYFKDVYLKSAFYQGLSS